jgi:hypothetical protein
MDVWWRLLEFAGQSACFLFFPLFSGFTSVKLPIREDEPMPKHCRRCCQPPTPLEPELEVSLLFSESLGIINITQEVFIVNGQIEPTTFLFVHSQHGLSYEVNFVLLITPYPVISRMMHAHRVHNLLQNRVVCGE